MTEIHADGANGQSPVFVSSTAARWLPRVLALALLALGLVAAARAGRIEPQPGVSVPPLTQRLVQSQQLFFALVGLLAGVAVIRGGAEVRTRARLGGEALHVTAGIGEIDIEYDKMERLEFASPFSQSRTRWLPATVIVDKWGQAFRLPATLQQGDRLIREIVRRSGREELAAWSQALQLEKRMGRPQLCLAVGYGLAVTAALAALIHGLS